MLPSSEHYQNIASRGSRAILESGGQPDYFLSHPEEDTRMGLALVFRPPLEIAAQTSRLLRRIRAIDPDQYYYPEGDMHVTVLDILRARPDFSCPDELLAQYSASIRRAVCACPPFAVTLRGVIASEGTILVKGYYEHHLEMLRQNLRAALAEDGLSPDERYETVSCHITTARFIKPIEKRQEVLQAIARHDELFIGRFTVDRLELVHHDWYDSKKQLLDEFWTEG